MPAREYFLSYERPIPKRFPDCSHYFHCLTTAAHADRRDLGCSTCDRYEPEKIDLCEIPLWHTGCFRLLWAVLVDDHKSRYLPIDLIEQVVFGPRPWPTII